MVVGVATDRQAILITPTQRIETDMTPTVNTPKGGTSHMRGATGNSLQFPTCACKTIKTIAFKFNLLNIY